MIGLKNDLFKASPARTLRINQNGHIDWECIQAFAVYSQTYIHIYVYIYVNAYYRHLVNLYFYA